MAKIGGKSIVFATLVVSQLNIGAIAAPPDEKKTPGGAIMDITEARFGTAGDGREVRLYTLTNGTGMKVKIINYGGIVTELWAPDRNGKREDIVLGFDSLKGYLAG